MSAPKLHRTTVRLTGHKLSDGTDVHPNQPGYGIAVTPGLATCHAWSFLLNEPDETSWLLVHEASGLSLGPSFLTRRDTLTVATQLTDIDWTRDADELRRDQFVERRVKAAVEAVYS